MLNWKMKVEEGIENLERRLRSAMEMNMLKRTLKVGVELRMYGGVEVHYMKWRTQSREIDELN